MTIAKKKTRKLPVHIPKFTVTVVKPAIEKIKLEIRSHFCICKVSMGGVKQ